MNKWRFVFWWCSLLCCMLCWVGLVCMVVGKVMAIGIAVVVVEGVVMWQ